MVLEAAVFGTQFLLSTRERWFGSSTGTRNHSWGLPICQAPRDPSPERTHQHRYSYGHRAAEMCCGRTGMDPSSVQLLVRWPLLPLNVLPPCCSVTWRFSMLCQQLPAPPGPGRTRAPPPAAGSCSPRCCCSERVRR